MNIIQQLSKIKQLYSEGKNILDYIKIQSQTSENTIEAIMVSYDFQAGSYIKFAAERAEYVHNYTSAIAKIIDQCGKFNSILEIGVGEATTLANVVVKLNQRPKKVLGFDISWSRIKYAKKYCNDIGLPPPLLFMGDIFNAPLQDNSIDIVYTSHSIEPNGGKEQEALIELYRIAKKYLILLEPSFEFANEEARERMNRLGYVKNLSQTAKDLGYKIIENRLFDYSSNPLNPTGLIIIEKNGSGPSVEEPLACPVTKAPLQLIRNNYYCKESLLVYPVIDDVPCLLSNNAIIATHYSDLM